MFAIAGSIAVSSAEGCSSDDATPAGTTPDAAVDTTPEPDLDSGGKADAADTCPPALTLTIDGAKKELGWKKAIATPGACTEDELATLEASGSVPYDQLADTVSPGCAACAISYDTDANWQPWVFVKTDAGKTTGSINFGACFGHVEGEACGEAIALSEFCRDTACNECAGSKGSSRDACVKAAEATGGPCAAFAANTKTSCPGFAKTVSSCNTVYQGVRTLCGVPADGGTDAGTD